MGAQLYAELPCSPWLRRGGEELDRHLRLQLRSVLWEGDEALLTSTSSPSRRYSQSRRWQHCCSTGVSARIS